MYIFQRIAVTAIALLFGLPAVASAASAQLSWTPNTEPDLAGYIAFYGTASGTYSHQLDVGDVSAATIPSLTAGDTYYFAVKAYDISGNQSNYSTEVVLEVPANQTDTTPPRLLGAESVGADTLVLTFSEALDPAIAGDVNRYLVDGTVSPLAVQVSADGITVTLTLPVQSDGSLHQITVSGVTDASGNPVTTLTTFRVNLAFTVSVTAPSGYTTATVTEGDTYYVDRTFRIDGIPAELRGATWIRTANNDKTQTAADWLRFTVNRDAIVYVGYDRRIAPPAWLTDQFVPVGEGPTSNDASTPLSLWARNVAGGPVVLGGNAGTGSHYVVLVDPMNTSGTASDGDGDRMADAWEIAMGLDPQVMNAHGDADGDGLTNLQEFWLQSDPVAVVNPLSPAGNGAPVLNVDATLVATVGQTVALDASGATDPDGDALSFGWTQLAGPLPVLSHTDQASASFSPLVPGTYTFRLNVTDARGAMAGQTVYLEVFESILVSVLNSLDAFLLVNQGALGGAMLDIPTGTFSKSHQIAIGATTLPAPLPGTHLISSDVLHFAPANVTIPDGATIRVPFGATRAKAGDTSGTPVLMWYDPDQGAWVEVAGTTTTGSALEATVTHLGTFTVARTGTNGTAGTGTGTGAGAAGGGCSALPQGAPGAPLDSALILAPLMLILLRLTTRRRSAPFAVGAPKEANSANV